MKFFPQRIASATTSISREKINGNFSSMVRPEKSDIEQHFIFQGELKGDLFVLFPILKIPNRYSPLIKGEIAENMQKIHIRLFFRLPAEARTRLTIYTVASIILTAFFILGYNAWLYGSITLGFGLVNYILAREHFAAQVRKTQHGLNKLFSFD